MKRIIYLLVAAIGLLVGCTPDEETLSLQLIDKRSEIYFKKVKRDE